MCYRLLFLVLVFLCSGCQKPTEAQYQKDVQNWIGKTPAELITTWGEPTQVIDIHDQQYYIYTWIKDIPLPSAQAEYPDGELQYITPLSGTPANNLDLFCQTTFVAENGIIIDWSFEGNDCTAK